MRLVTSSKLVFALTLFILALGGIPQDAIGMGKGNIGNGGPPPEQATSPSEADVPPKGKPYGIGGNQDGSEHNGRDRDDGKLNNDIGAFFGSDTRQAVNNHYGNNSCPPGLAKKGNGCLPPGQAKKSYQLGQRLPTGIEVGSIPRELSRHLGAAPNGYNYGYVDGDVVLMDAATRFVVDAIAR